MDYIEAFAHLHTNPKWGRKSPHKAILLLTVIEMYETNILMDNEIHYDETLKDTFQKMWAKILPDESLFCAEAYLPFWYMQSEQFWHIVPQRGKEDVLNVMRDNHVKPSETKLMECVSYVELDEDLYFLMSLPSGRASLKQVLLENYTSLSESQIETLSAPVDNAIDLSATAMAEFEKIVSDTPVEAETDEVNTDGELVRQFQCINEDIQIVLNLQYYSFMKSHRGERGMFKEVCPTVYALLDRITCHPVRPVDIIPSFAFTYENFLSDLKIALMSEDESMELIDRIDGAIDALRGGKKEETNLEPTETVINPQLSRLDRMEYTPDHEERVTDIDTVDKKKANESGEDCNAIIRREKPEILKEPYYAVRVQAILRAMGTFRLPASVRDIARTISRTAWGAPIRERDVEEIINTIPEFESVDGKYILRKKR